MSGICVKSPITQLGPDPVNRDGMTWRHPQATPGERAAPNERRRIVAPAQQIVVLGDSLARRVQVLLCGMETPPLRSYARAFHDLHARVAERYNVSLVPFLLEGVALRGDLNYDGIQPNAAGAKRVAENVWPYLDRLLAGLTAKVEGLRYD